MELAAFAFPPDPPRFAFVPNATPVQKEEAWSAGRWAVAQIETRNPLRRRGDEQSVAVGMFVRGVGPVGHQREMQIAFGAREIMNLEPFDQVFHALQRREQRWYGDERAQMRGHTVDEAPEPAAASRQNWR